MNTETKDMNTEEKIETEHTPEPWPETPHREIFEDIDDGGTDAWYDNRVRSIICVNACAGMKEPGKEIAVMRAEQRETIAFLKKLRRWMISAIDAGCENIPEFDPATHENVMELDAIIAKAEGRAE